MQRVKNGIYLHQMMKHRNMNTCINKYKNKTAFVWYQYFFKVFLISAIRCLCASVAKDFL